MNGRRESYSGRILAISAIIISFSALIVSIWQGYESRLNNRNSVRPILIFSLDFSHNAEKQGIVLSNKGVGPGLIHTFSFFYKGEKLNFLSDSDVIASTRKLGLFKNISLTKDIKVSIPEDSVFEPTQKRLIIGFQKEDATPDRGNYMRELAKFITATVDYTDVYGTKFQTHYKFE